ncbi:hypothetical protein BC833DRAFT_598683 [Globomyces pollinis-pini]|nr:hypothetical protein BC833DRAFT_598683 [Globomyces pollinis-pini]
MEQQTLPVGQLNSTGIPMTGEEYLAMVRSEANQIPHLMVSKTKIDQPDYSNTILTNHRQIFIETENPYKIPTHLYPTQGWLSTQLNQFNILKSKLNSLNAEDCKVQIGKVNDWIAYCKVKENQPTLKLLKTLNQQKTITLLQRMVQLSTMDSIKLFVCI